MHEEIGDAKFGALLAAARNTFAKNFYEAPECFFLLYAALLCGHARKGICARDNSIGDDVRLKADAGCSVGGGAFSAGSCFDPGGSPKEVLVEGV